MHPVRVTVNQFVLQITDDATEPTATRFDVRMWMETLPSDLRELAMLLSRGNSPRQLEQELGITSKAMTDKLQRLRTLCEAAGLTMEGRPAP